MTWFETYGHVQKVRENIKYWSLQIQIISKNIECVKAFFLKVSTWVACKLTFLFPYKIVFPLLSLSVLPYELMHNSKNWNYLVIFIYEIVCSYLILTLQFLSI